VYVSVEGGGLVKLKLSTLNPNLMCLVYSQRLVELGADASVVSGKGLTPEDEALCYGFGFAHTHTLSLSLARAHT
jgi:hypothetical protein